MHASFIPVQIMVTLHVHQWKSVTEVNHTVEESNGSGSMRWKSAMEMKHHEIEPVHPCGLQYLLECKSSI